MNKEAKELSNKIRSSHISIINDHLLARPLLEGLSLLSGVTLHFISRCVENNYEKMNQVIELYCQNINKAHNYNINKYHKYKKEKSENGQEIMERLISSFYEISKNDTPENNLNASFLFFVETFIKYSDKKVSLEEHAENIKENFINAYKSIETEE